MVSVLSKMIQAEGKKLELELSVNGSLRIEATLPDAESLNEPLTITVLVMDRNGEEIAREPFKLSVWFQGMCNMTWDEFDITLFVGAIDLEDCLYKVLPL